MTNKEKALALIETFSSGETKKALVLPAVGDFVLNVSEDTYLRRKRCKLP